LEPRRPIPRIYLVTPPVADPVGVSDGLAPALAAALGAGDVAAVLLRLAAADERTLINHAKALAPIVQAKAAALLIDGRPEIVVRAAADGAHARGVAELDEALALKPARIAGCGGLATRHDAMVAAESGADYVMFGEPDAAPAQPSRPCWARRVVGGGV
jgi:thiamine-phosphate pyrophosphorylase